MFLMTEFINLKIKLTQSFESDHRGECMYVFIGVSAHTCINTYIYTVFLKKKLMRYASINVEKRKWFISKS
jgi:hypothetical protein